MTVDELQHTFASLADRFRDELARELQAAVADVVTRAAAERETAVQDAATRARSEAETEALAKLEAARAEAETAAHAKLETALAEAETRSRATAEDALARLNAEHAAAIEEAVARARKDAEERAAAQLQVAVQEAEERGRVEVRKPGAEWWRSGLTTADTVRVHKPESPEDGPAETLSAPRLLEAVRTLDRASSLTEMLEALLSAAALEATRVGLLLRIGDELRGWRFIGFGPNCDPPSSVVVLAEGAGILEEAVRAGDIVVPKADGEDETPWFAQPAASDSARVAMPIVLGGDVVAVFYADDGGQQSADRSDASSAHAAIELLVRHTARCLEAATSLKAFRILAQSREAGSARVGANRAEPARRAGDTEESARRYARLLVSEIKLYHETAVVAGRRERDLSTRLGGEIARARALYEQRVPQETHGHMDYFHDELVRTLADGDPSLLERTT